LPDDWVLQLLLGSNAEDTIEFEGMMNAFGQLSSEATSSKFLHAAFWGAPAGEQHSVALVTAIQHVKPGDMEAMDLTAFLSRTLLRGADSQDGHRLLGVLPRVRAEPVGDAADRWETPNHVEFKSMTGASSDNLLQEFFSNFNRNSSHRYEHFELDAPLTLVPETLKLYGGGGEVAWLSPWNLTRFLMHLLLALRKVLHCPISCPRAFTPAMDGSAHCLFSHRAGRFSLASARC
jgi:hypothetical protein